MTEDPFDLAADRELELQQEAEERRNRKLLALEHAYTSQMSTVVTFGILLVVHGLIVKEWTGWLIAHAIFIGLTAMGAVGAWGELRNYKARDELEVGGPGRVNINVIRFPFFNFVRVSGKNDS